MSLDSKELPSGWRRVALGELVLPTRPRHMPRDYGHLPFVGMEHVQAHSTRLLGTVSAHTMSSSAVHFWPGDVLYGRLRPYLNKVHCAEMEGLCSGEFIVLPSNANVDGKYLQYYLNSSTFVQFATGLNTGDRPRVDFAQIAEFKLRIPPLPEQGRIVDAIEEQFTRLDAAVASLQRARANLKRYRAAVIDAAVKGRLVFRAHETLTATEDTGISLLANILEIQRQRSRGKPANARHRTNCEPPPAENLPKWDLPTGWVWASVAQVAELVTDGDHNPPKRVPSGVPHLTAKNVKRGRLSTDDCTFITVADFERTKGRFEPRAGDIIVTCVGTVGEVAVVPEDFLFSADRNLAGIRLVSPGVTPRWVELVLTSPEWRNLIASASGSTAQPHLYLGDLRPMAIPLPPLVTQKTILAEVELRLSAVVEAEDAVQPNLKRAMRLRQAILKRAFEGKLVPQDSTDEAAGVFLERLRTERTNTNGATRPLPQRLARVAPATRATQAPLLL